MIVRRYVDGIQVEGLDVSVNGMSMTISPGKIILPNGTGILDEEVTLDFSPSVNGSNVVIGFDMFGRMYVERNDIGEKRQDRKKFGILTHYIYFTIEPDTEDLRDILINVLYPPLK